MQHSAKGPRLAAAIISLTAPAALGLAACATLAGLDGYEVSTFSGTGGANTGGTDAVANTGGTGGTGTGGSGVPANSGGTGTGGTSEPPANNGGTGTDITVDCVVGRSDDLFGAVATDMADQLPDDAVFTRYLSLNNQSCKATLDVERTSIRELIDSMSDGLVVPPEPVDFDDLLYRIDLRDYGWDVAITVAGVQYRDVWEAVRASNPYAVAFAGDDANPVRADSGTDVAVMLANSFVAVAAQPSFAQALEDAGIDVAPLPESAAQVALEFAADVDVTTAAGDLYIAPDFLLYLLNQLPPTLSVLDGGTLDRNQFSRDYVESLCVVSNLKLANAPRDSVCGF